MGAGPFEAKKVKGCTESSTRKFWTNDSYVKFPTSERYWEASQKKSTRDQGRYKSVTADNVVMLLPVTTRFTLKTDCDTLKEFYNKFARRMDAHFESSNSYPDGWSNLISQLIGDPVDFTLDRIIQKYNWRDVWKNPETKTKIEKELTTILNASSNLLIQTANGKQYFQHFSVIIGSPDPENPALKQAVAEEQTRVSQAQSEEAQARADAAKAEAQLAVSRAEAAKQRAAIAGYPNIQSYLKAMCIEKGCNPFQPTYLYGGAPAK